MAPRLPVASFPSPDRGFTSPTDFGFVPTRNEAGIRGANGVVNHGKRLDLDENVSISQLLLRVSELEATVLRLTKLLS